MPRYEFRVFEPELEQAEALILAHSPCNDAQDSSELYVVSRETSDVNLKIREERLELKILLERKHGLELWNPAVVENFPVKASLLQNEIFSAFKVEAPAFQRSEYDIASFLDEIVDAVPALTKVRVTKDRCKLIIDDCMVELTEVEIDDVPLKSIAIESEDVEMVLHVRHKLNLDDYTNTSYVKAIKRVKNR
jgi:hypothetical protein